MGFISQVGNRGQWFATVKLLSLVAQPWVGSGHQLVVLVMRPGRLLTGKVDQIDCKTGNEDQMWEVFQYGFSGVDFLCGIGG